MENKFPIRQRINLPGNFADQIVLEGVCFPLDGFECRVLLLDGSPDETIVSNEETEELFQQSFEAESSVPPVEANQLRLLIESARISLSCTHDRHFALSLSGIRTLPHQKEAVYLSRLRFLLANDLGAGKTIMAGLLLKEMKLRQAVERVHIFCQAPLTIQWQH